VVFLFVGRLTVDKGVLDLAQAFVRARPDMDADLVLVGYDHEGLAPRIRAIGESVGDRLRVLPMTATPEDAYAAGDVFCLPSYREGFATVVIEAGAAELPVLGTRIYGLADAIQEGVTGLLHEPGDIAGLAAQMKVLSADAELRSRLGRAGRAMMTSRFSRERLGREWVRYYAALSS
jgi:glycosyltransferase involved in cell wall biosynthesis